MRLRLAWVVVGVVLAAGPAACAQPKPAAPGPLGPVVSLGSASSLGSSEAAPLHPFRPAAGTPEIVCAEARGKACESESACEEACGDGDAASCLGLAQRLRAPPPATPAGGDRAADRARRAKRGVELTRIACTRGLVDACQALALTPDAAAADKAVAFTALEASCQKAAGCACVALGEGLLADPADDRRTHGLEVLDAACVHGADRACDLADEAAYRCTGVGAGDPVCLALERDGRLRPPPSVATPLPVPPAALGCFVVRAPSAARDAGARGDAVCIAADRVFARDRSGAWDGWRCAWSTTGGLAKCKGDGPLTELRLLAGGGMGAELHHERVLLRRLTPAGTQAALAEVAKLPSIEGACAAAVRCVASYGGGYDGPPAQSLGACLHLAREMRKMIRDDAAHGRKGSHPEQCPEEASR